jgi:hypothetical protein
MNKVLRVPRAWVAVGALAAAAMAVPAASASADTNTICSAAGLPSSTVPLAIPGVVHVTVTTCDAAILPPTPPCATTIDLSGVLHVSLFACLPGQTAGPQSTSSTNGSTIGISGLAATTMSTG